MKIQNQWLVLRRAFTSVSERDSVRDFDRSKLPKLVQSSGPKGMRPFWKSRWQILRLVLGSDTFQNSDFKHTYFINYKLDTIVIQRELFIFLIVRNVKKNYIGTTTDAFRRRDSITIKVVWIVTEGVSVRCPENVYTLIFLVKTTRVL